MYKAEYKFICWNTVRLLRMLVIVMLETFFINPIHRLLIVSPIFVIFLIHDINARPFKSIRLNLLQILSSACLLLIVLCNVVFAFSYMSDITGIPDMNITVNILMYIEYLLLVILLPIWFVIWKVCTSLGNTKEKDKQD